METAYSAFRILEAMAKDGNPNSITDVGVGVHCAHTAVEGGALNVRINLGSIKDAEYCTRMEQQVADLRNRSAEAKARILALVEEKM
jgi:glutamate formiminotransferase/formiminotetrahydrofolate cyclodeaminase